MLVSSLQLLVQENQFIAPFTEIFVCLFDMACAHRINMTDYYYWSQFEDCAMMQCGKEQSDKGLVGFLAGFISHLKYLHESLGRHGVLSSQVGSVGFP